MRNDEIGIVEHEVVVQEDVDVERARTPAFDANASSFLLQIVRPIEQRVRFEPGGDSDNGVQERVLLGTADGIGLVDARDGLDRDVRRSREGVDRRLQMTEPVAEVRARARGRPCSPFDAHADVRKLGAYGRMHLAHFDDDPFDPRVGATHFGDAGREPFEQFELFRRDHPAHRFTHRGVVDGVVEVVGVAGLGEVDLQFEVDLERLRTRVLFRKYAVDAELADSR